MSAVRKRKRLYNVVSAGAVMILMALFLSSAVSGIEYQNIYTDYQKQFSHFAPAGKHSDTESYKYDTSLGSTVQEQLQMNLDRRHANCNDCHDPHSATRGPSPLGSYFGAGTQANVSGVKPLYGSPNSTTITVKTDSTHFTVGDAASIELAVGATIVIDTQDTPHTAQTLTVSGLSGNDVTVSTALSASHVAGCTVRRTVPAGQAPPFAFVSSVVKEYELCFKCHSSYSFNFALYKQTYGYDVAYNWTQNRYYLAGDATSDIIVPETDLAVEFNPNNFSYHPVLAKGQTPGTFDLKWAEDPLVPGSHVDFNQTFTPGLNADSRLKCTDCHASDSTNVKGPHGSAYKYILRKRAPTEEPTITRNGYNLGSRYFTSSAGFPGTAYRERAYNMTWYVRTEDLLCYICHDMKYYGPGRGHPSRGKHWSNCEWHRPIAMDEVGCASCKVTPVHGAPGNKYLMKLAAKADDPNDKNWCYNCHNLMPAQYGSGQFYGGGTGYPSCPRFYSMDENGLEKEETRVHFQSSRLMPGSEYFVPLPTPDMPNLKGLGNIPEYRYYNREDDYILFKYGVPKKTTENTYKVRFDQPSSGDRPDGEPVGEVGYEDSISLWTLDHAKDTQVYLSVDGDVLATKSIKKAKQVTDSLGNDITDVINTRTSNKDDRSGWFTGTIGYGNTIAEIYDAGNSFVMDFGDLSQEKTIKLVWGVNEEKGGKLPILIQIKDEKGTWITRGSARISEDRYGFLDIKSFFPKGTKDYKVKVIPTLNAIDFMAISVKDSPVKVTKLALEHADYTKAGSGNIEDMTARLAAADKDYVTFDYRDTVDLYFEAPDEDKTLSKRDFVFAPTGYYETGGDINSNAVLDPMTAEKAQDFGVLTPAGGYANHYTIELIDPGAWNERYAAWLPK